MPDELKKILQHELDELKENKVRAIALGVCFAALLFYWLIDDSSSEKEIKLNEPPITADAQPVTKDFPVVSLPEKSADGVTPILGANPDPIFIGDPFAEKEKPAPPPKVVTPPETPPSMTQSLPKIPEQFKTPEQPKPQKKEKIVLTGTAISGANKTAMFLRGKETLFLTIADEIDGKKISDISPDSVTFADGESIFIQRELR